MRRALWTFLLVITMLAGAPPAEARDFARDMRRYIGYSVVQVATVARVSPGLGGRKILTMQDGGRFLVSGLVPPPPFTEVVVFARKAGSTYLVMLMIGNEAYDAEPM